MPTAAAFRDMPTGETFAHEGRELRFVRFRKGKATCVDADTGARVNLFPTEDDPTPPAEE